MGDAYDVAVIGSGTGGYSAALRAAQLGKRVVLIDKDDRLGGTCLLRGCIPTKALLQSAAVMDTVNRSSTWGIQANGSPDWPRIVDAEGAVVDSIVSGLTGLISARGIEVVHGAATFVGGNRIAVGDRSIEATDIVLATGSRPKLLPGVTISDRVITSDEALWAERLPESAIVIGAGAVGLEFASMYRSFGAEVTIVEALPQLAPLEDADVSKELARAFRKRGITSAVGAVVKDLKDTDSAVASLHVRVKAAGALLRLGDSSGLPILQELMANESPAMRLDAAEALASQPDSAWMGLVTELARDPDPEIRAAAGRLLAPHDPEMARGILASLTSDENPAIRELASRGLGEALPDDLPTLRRLMRTSHSLSRVRAAARVLVLTR